MQSGSDQVLKAMRRSYRQARYLSIIDSVRAALPEAAITTDIIVGFPGETEDDFGQTLHAVERARFASAFTFQYSQRPGTPAAAMAEQVPKPVVQERYERLIDLQEQISWDENKRLIGHEVEVLVSTAVGKKDGATGRVTGRARDGRLIHVATGQAPVEPGDVVRTRVTYAAPHHLVADGPMLSTQTWRGRSGAVTPANAGAGTERRPLLTIGRRPD
jgi:tRNA-2-methylthio-N6-dimethylallyladenosine synthase